MTETIHDETVSPDNGFKVLAENNDEVRFLPNKNEGTVHDADDVAAMQETVEDGERRYLGDGTYYVELNNREEFAATIRKDSCDNHRCSITEESIEAAADYLNVGVDVFEQDTRGKVVRTLAREGVPKADVVAAHIGADTATFTVTEDEAEMLQNVGFATTTREVDGETLYILLCDELEALNVNAWEQRQVDDYAHVAAEEGAPFDVSLLN